MSALRSIRCLVKLLCTIYAEIPETVRLEVKKSGQQLSDALGVNRIVWPQVPIRTHVRLILQVTLNLFIISICSGVGLVIRVIIRLLKRAR